MSSANVRQEGDRVHISIDGRMWDLPWQAALELSKVLYQRGKLAEEYAHANRIIADHALLTRAGFPIGLSNNPRIKDEVRKEAAWNGDLRRYLPGGVKSSAVFGTPSVRSIKP